MQFDDCIRLHVRKQCFYRFFFTCFLDPEILFSLRR